jgi:hypothetical protein
MRKLRGGFYGRVAHPFRAPLVLVDRIPAEGAPSFRVLCERVGSTGLKPSRFLRPWFPPLQRTQGWGTPCRGGIGNRKGGTTP